MACPVEAWKAASSVVAGENVLDSMASPQMATRGFWATPRVRDGEGPEQQQGLGHDSFFHCSGCFSSSGWRRSSSRSTPTFRVGNLRATTCRCTKRNQSKINGNNGSQYLNDTSSSPGVQNQLRLLEQVAGESYGLTRGRAPAFAPRARAPAHATTIRNGID